MANAKITDLPELAGSGLGENDVLVIVNGGITKKIKYGELLSNAALDEITDASLPSAKISFAAGSIVEASMAANSVDTTSLVDGNVTAAKLADDSSAVVATALPGSGDYKGQLAIDTDHADGHRIYVWDGTNWKETAAGASVNSIVGSTENLVNIVATAGGTPSGNQYTIDATIDAFNANTFLAGPNSGSAAVPTRRTILAADLATAKATDAAIGAVQVNGGGLTVDGNGLISVDNTVTAQTNFAVVKCDAKGLITETQTLAASTAELPKATSSAVGGVIVDSAGGLTVNSDGNISISNNITGATKTKITYNTDGLVTSGDDLAASDIPNLDTAKITSGTFDTARIANDAIDSTKLADASTCIVQSISQQGFPTAAFKGQLCFDSVAEDAYLWDGNAWQAITTLTKGSLVNGGTFNASTSKMASVTSAGTAAGLVVGSNLPTASSSVDGVYVVVATAGTPSSPAPAVSLNPPDYILGVTNASGSSWQEIDLSATVSGQVASNVGFTPYGDISSSNVQDALQEVSTEKMPKSGGTFTGAVEIGHGGSFKFEGGTNDAYETTLAVVDPTAARTITLPNDSGTVILAAKASIVNADVATNAAIDYSKLAALADGKVLIGNGSNVPTAVTPSGDITISNAGVAAIGSGVIVDADVNASAAIAGSKLAAGSTSAQGALQLSDATDSTSTSLAATANAVRVTKEVADAALPKAGGTLLGNINLDNDKQINLYEADTSGSAYIGLKAPTDMGSTSSYTLSLPATAPTANKVLKCDASTPTTLVWGDDTTNVAAGDLTGTTMASNVVTSSLTTVGTVANGTWAATDVAILHGGTGASTASAARTNLGVAIGSDVQAYDADIAKKDAAQTWSVTQSGTITSIAYGSSVSLNLNTTNNFVIGQLTGAFTLANPSALTPGASGAIKITQHASSPVTPGWGTYWHFPTGSGNANLTQTNGAVDVLVYTVLTSTSIACQLIKDIQD